MNEHLRPSYSILALGESADDDHFLQVQVVAKGRRKISLLSLRDLLASSEKAINHLDAPLLTRASRSRFLENAQQAFETLKPTFHVATKPGWSKGIFILPNGTCVPATNDFEVCLPMELRPFTDKFCCLGTLSDWRRIPELAKGNSRFMLALALAFTGPVVKAFRFEAPMIQLFGAAGSGKSSIGVAVGSVWGGGDELFVQSWNHTANSAERIAAAFNSSFLVMDETRTANNSGAGQTAVILELIMRFAGGQMRGRQPDVRPPLRFETPMLSLSNFSLDEMGQKCREEIDDALRGRMIDVPLAPVIVGAFEDLHGFESHAKFSEELLAIARAHCGRAARASLKGFAAELRKDEASIKACLQERRARYLKHVRKVVISAGRDLERFHQKFATIYAAGALAIDYQILPWSRSELGKALVVCERAHVDHIAQFLPSSVSAPRKSISVDPLERLRQYVLQNRSEFVDLRKGLIAKNTGHNHEACLGYVNKGPGGLAELLFPKDVLVQLCGGVGEVNRLKDQLRKRGDLISESQRGVTRRSR
jgi:putative DNA primase/helicase